MILWGADDGLRPCGCHDCSCPGCHICDPDDGPEPAYAGPDYVVDDPWLGHELDR